MAATLGEHRCKMLLAGAVLAGEARLGKQGTIEVDKIIYKLLHTPRSSF